MTNAETQIAGFFAKFEPATAALGRALRAKLRARLPGLFEVVYVYERQGALVISYSPTAQGYEGVCSLGLSPDGVRLHFARGAELSGADAGKLLQGRGKTVRHVVLHAAEDLDHPEVEALMKAALRLAKVGLDAGAEGAVVIRAEARKERARRAARTSRPASARRAPKARRGRPC